MAEQQQLEPGVHLYRRRKKRRRNRHTLLKLTFVILFFVLWGYGVLKLTHYLAERNELGKKYHEVDPAGFDKDVKSTNPYR